MNTYIHVSFGGMAPDPSLESAVYRWVARLEAEYIEVVRAEARIEHTSRHTAVSLEVTLVSGSHPNTGVVHADPYVAVSDAFRSVRRQVVESRRPLTSVRLRLREVC